MKIKGKNYRKSFYLFNRLCKYLLVSFTLLTCCLSCQTFLKKKVVIPNDLSSYKAGAFSGTVIVYQKEKRNYFNGDVFISGMNKLRMDLSIFHGLSVFTLLLNKENIILFFLREQEFYKGRNINGVLPYFFSKDLKFSVFREIFFDRRPKDKEWICTIDEQNLPLECQNSTWTIQWNRGNKKILYLKTVDFGFTFQYSSFSDEVNNNLFSIEIPENFKRTSLVK